MRKLTLFTLLVLLVSGGIILAVSQQRNAQAVYQPDNTTMQLQHNSFSGAAKWIYERQANVQTGQINPGAVENAIRQIGRMQSSRNAMGLNWQFAGPSNIGGRCRAILVDEDNTDIIYAGGVSGGLWKSTTGGTSWNQVKYAGDNETALIPNLNISSICQTSNGDIYFGTGEFFANPYGSQNTGFQGAGIWKSTDGETFTRLSATWSTSDSKNTFVFVNKMVAHPSEPNTVYAATKRGLQMTTDGGLTWTNPILNIAGFPINEVCGDVEISSDGNSIIVDLGIQVYVSHEAGASDSWVKVTGSDEGELPTTSIRTELAIAPSDKNIMYAQTTKSDRSLLNIYRSTDGGLTWSIIGPGGSTEFNPLGEQGDYDNIIAVFPDNANEIMVGGQYSMWKWGLSTGWEMLSYWSLDIASPMYVHADQHEIRFNPNNPDIVYVGSDGGIHRSINRGNTWTTLNKNFGVTQFYAIGHDGTNNLIGGTQDNGTLFIDPDRTITSGLQNEAVEVSGGDGGYSEISQIEPSILFSTIYYGSLYRSEDNGETMAPFYNARLSNQLNPGAEESGHSFVTPISLWESFNDLNSIEMLTKIADRDYAAGEIVYVESNIKEHYVKKVLDEPLAHDDTLEVADHYQSRLAVGFKGSVWITKDALNFRVSANWIPVAKVRNETNNYEVVQCLEWSADGAYLYFATNWINGGFFNGSVLYRVGDFNVHRKDSARDADFSTYLLEVAPIAVFNDRHITGIGVDPEFSGNVVVSLGNYDNTNYVYYSTSANTAPAVATGPGSFVSKQGNLPAMPVYDALIVWSDSRKVIVGTEFGVFATSDITAANPVWTDENGEGMDYVPVYHLRQQIIPNGWMEDVHLDNGIRNHGYIWAGTHGRGIFKSTEFEGPVGICSNVADKGNLNLLIYPNPVTEIANLAFEITENTTNARLSLYNLEGKLVKTFDLNNVTKGKYQKQINVTDINNGVYMVVLTYGNTRTSAKFIKR
ncbi:MAG: T9SS type A sorting domain-containing protein [Bacteroidales bacterium]|nr:T9SS type A sorting domain-containing protein [Bacteroidales bacterium]HOY38902.1 T9SS type A sorting domain-containing protein [Bacteroidales bacterium]HQP04108.1 T9SS type A sorting domain-containing protein [Bacteroidales bacterium]